MTQTLAKGPGQYVDGVAPTFAVRGKGARLWDTDGNEYLDWQMAIGPLVLGYGHPVVDEAIRAQLEDGITFSLVHPLEVEVAEAVRRLIPNAEMVRYSKTGCDVTSAAVRLARAYTGRDKVLCCGYHGWHDWYIGVTDRSRGVPRAVSDLTFTFDYNDLEGVLAALDEEVACVVLEPVAFEAPREGFLAKLRDACKRRGALLVFDEMWTGFRLSLGGAQAHFDVQADLACFSKAVANGMPLSVLTGPREVMQLLDRDVFFFTTFGGEALSLAAAKATLRVLENERIPDRLASTGRALRDGYNAIARELGLSYTACVGLDCRSLVTFSAKDEAAGADPLEMKSLVQQELFSHGLLWGGFHNVSAAHSDADVDRTLSAYRKSLAVLATAVSKGRVHESLRGRPVEPVFRKTSHFNSKPRRA
jgi:glutamate-1-semialdehyde aminotransferase